MEPTPKANDDEINKLAQPNEEEPKEDELDGSESPVTAGEAD